jgi:hypothetical protein
MCYEQVSNSLAATKPITATTNATALKPTTNEPLSTSSTEITTPNKQQPTDNRIVLDSATSTNVTLVAAPLVIVPLVVQQQQSLPTATTTTTEQQDEIEEYDRKLLDFAYFNSDDEEFPPTRLIMGNTTTNKQQVVRNSTTISKQHQIMSTEQATQQLGQAASRHLERMCYEMLVSEAPLLCKEMEQQQHDKDDNMPLPMEDWVNLLLTLATRCCATVRPNV